MNKIIICALFIVAFSWLCVCEARRKGHQSLATYEDIWEGKSEPFIEHY